MKKYLIILLCLLVLGGCIPFVLCGGSNDASVLIITDEKNLDEKLLNDIFLLDEKKIEKRKFKNQQKFLETMKRNGFICKNDICNLFYIKYFNNTLDFYDEKIRQGSLTNITISYNKFFKTVDISENFNFTVETQYKAKLFRIDKTNLSYMSDQLRKKIIYTILPISIKKENLYQFFYNDPRDSCERSEVVTDTKQLEKNSNILLEGMQNGISK